MCCGRLGPGAGGFALAMWGVPLDVGVRGEALAEVVAQAASFCWRKPGSNPVTDFAFSAMLSFYHHCGGLAHLKRAIKLHNPPFSSLFPISNHCSIVNLPVVKEEFTLSNNHAKIVIF